MSELQQAVEALQRAQTPHPDCKNTESDYPTDWDGIMPAALRVALAVVDDVDHVHSGGRPRPCTCIFCEERAEIRAAFGGEERG